MTTVAIPIVLTLITGAIEVGWGLPMPVAVLPVVVGAAFVAAGLSLMFRTISLFAAIGRGTLAPWDPTSKLVVLGPYRHVRNPMISGVMMVMLGETAILGSLPMLGWFAIFSTLNLVFIPTIEEPRLTRQFGDEYATYRQNVPRWIPRLRPWNPG